MDSNVCSIGQGEIPYQSETLGLAFLGLGLIGCAALE